jgi:hypothetical protein
MKLVLPMRVETNNPIVEPVFCKRFQLCRRLVPTTTGDRYGYHDTFAHRHRVFVAWRRLLWPKALVLARNDDFIGRVF